VRFKRRTALLPAHLSAAPIWMGLGRGTDLPGLLKYAAARMAMRK
jgi:hypothetical protein